MRKRAVSLGGDRARYAPLAPGAEDATPERLAHAARDGLVRAEAGVRRLADPFDALHRRGLLDGDVVRNDLLWEAGARFRRHWHGSRLDGLTAFDFARPAVDGGGAVSSTPTEAALRHRDALRRASEAVGPRLLPILRGVVLEARPASALAALVRETSHARTAEALAVERLREGLYRLCEHWGLFGRPEPVSRRPCRD